MAFIENIKKNGAYRVCVGVDPSTGQKIYDRISFTTAAEDVIFDDNKDLTEKMEDVSETITALSSYASATLTAGETTVTVTGDNITADGMLDIYVPIAFCKVTPESITNQIDGAVTLTFPEQESDMEVRVICKG